MKTLLSVAFVLIATPTFAQVSVLSNENLGQVKQQFTVTPEVWQGLPARQFVYVPPTEGPPVTIIPDSEPAHYEIPPTYPLTNNS